MPKTVLLAEPDENGRAMNSSAPCGATSGPKIAISTRIRDRNAPMRVRHSRSDRVSSVVERTGGVGVSTPSARAGADSV